MGFVFWLPAKLVKLKSRKRFVMFR